MRVLILTTALGQGHNSVAEALQMQFSSKDVECRILDIYEHIDPRLKDVVSKGHIFSMRSIELIHDTASDLYDRKEKLEMQTDSSFPKFSNLIIASSLKTYITGYDPSLIICTQVYPAQVISIMKERGVTNALTIGVLTDFTIQSYWQDTEYIDYIITPSELLSYQLTEHGIDLKKILPFGIPIAKKFYAKESKKIAREQLGLDPDKKTLLLMGGSMGFGKIDSYMKELDQHTLDFQALVVCGANKRLYSKATKLELKKDFHIYNYVDNIDIMMDAADCIISKPGGITVSESLAKNLPMIIINPLPGVEVRNVEFMINNGLSLFVSKAFTLGEALYLFYQKRKSNLEENIRLEMKPDASELLWDFLVQRQSQ